MLPTPRQDCSSSGTDSTEPESSDEDLVEATTNVCHVTEASAVPRAMKRRKVYMQRRSGEPTRRLQPPPWPAHYQPEVHAQGYYKHYFCYMTGWCSDKF